MGFLCIRLSPEEESDIFPVQQLPHNFLKEVILILYNKLLENRVQLFPAPQQPHIILHTGVLSGTVLFYLTVKYSFQSLRLGYIKVL